MPHTITLHRIFRASPQKIYRAFLNPDALAKWLPPHGFTAKVHFLDAVVGGSFRISFTNFSSGKQSSFGGEYLELREFERLRYSDRFDDPNLRGDIETCIDLRQVQVGTAVHINQTGIPEVVPAEACYLGWQESLSQLADLVEVEIPD